MPVAALVPLIVVALAYMGFCLWDLFRSGVGPPARWWWAAAIVFSIPVGGLVWLLWGRDRA